MTIAEKVRVKVKVKQERRAVGASLKEPTMFRSVKALSEYLSTPKVIKQVSPYTMPSYTQSRNVKRSIYPVSPLALTYISSLSSASPLYATRHEVDDIHIDQC